MTFVFDFYVMREAKLYLVDLVSHCHMKEPLPDGLSTAPASLLLIASRPVVALPWPFLEALLGLSTAQVFCSCCCIIHIEVFAFGARL